MTLVAVLGTKATVGTGAAGATDITDWVSSVDLGDSLNANDVTTLGHTATVEDPGLESFDLGLQGFWDASIDATLRAEKGVKDHHLIIKPAGAGTGNPQYDYVGWMDALSLSIAPGDPITWETTFHAKSLTVTTL